MPPPTATLQCPKCHASFEYEYLTGASFTSIRLGSRRAMRCPQCRRFSSFDLHPPEGSAAPPRGALPRYDDRRPTLWRLTRVVVPAVGALTAVSLLAPRPEPAFEISVGGSIALALALLAMVRRSLPPRGWAPTSDR